jgi:hypothetical protein
MAQKAIPYLTLITLNGLIDMLEVRHNQAHNYTGHPDIHASAIYSFVTCDIEGSGSNIIATASMAGKKMMVGALQSVAPTLEINDSRDLQPAIESIQKDRVKFVVGYYNILSHGWRVAGNSGHTISATFPVSEALAEQLRLRVDETCRKLLFIIEGPKS